MALPRGAVLEEKLNSWLAEHQRWPSQKAKDPQERKLGQWVGQRGGQQTVYQSFLTAENQAIEKLKPKEAAPVLLDPHDANIAVIGQFIQRNRRWPSRVASDKDERYLARWIASVGGQKAVLQYLDFTQQHILHRSPSKRPHESYFEEVKKFIIANGRWPEQLSKNKHEWRLAMWVSQNGGQGEVWQLLPDSLKYSFEVRMKGDPIGLVSDFIVNNGRWPSEKGQSPQERSLAYYISHHGRRASVYPRITQKARDALGPALLQSYFDRLETFILQNKRFPQLNESSQEGKQLREFVKSNGGNATFFANYLTDDARITVRNFKQIPEAREIRKAILQIRPGPNFFSKLRPFVKNFMPHEINRAVNRAFYENKEWLEMIWMLGKENETPMSILSNVYDCEDKLNF